MLMKWNVTNTFHHEVCMVDYNVYKSQVRFTWNQWQIYNVLYVIYTWVVCSRWHQECDLKHPSLVDFISTNKTKQNKQITFLHR
jgi:hypothetical protein